MLHIHSLVHRGMLQVRSLKRRNARFVNQRKPDIVQPLQQTIPPERIHFERIPQPVIIGNHLLPQIHSDAITFLLLRPRKKLVNLVVRKGNRQNPILEAVIVKNVRITRRQYGVKSVIQNRPRRVFAARTTTEIRPRQNHRGALIPRRVQNKLRIRLLPRQISPIIKQHAPIPLPRLQFQKLFRHHLIRIYVHAIQRRHQSRMLDKRFHRHSAPSTLFHLRMSTKWPSIAAAAAITGLTRCVRPPLPCRPSKLRLEVLAERSPLSRTSSFMPMHMLQPASRHSKPAATKILSSPSASASAFTTREPGTTSACFKDFATCFPSTIFAAARKSSSREFVHEPMNTRSSEISSIAVPGFKSIYTSARVAASRSTGSLKDAGSGTRSETCVTIPGFVPHVTIGAKSRAWKVKVSSYFASGSVGRVCQKSSAA